MPQLDFHNPMTISQVVWMFLIFGLLYMLLATWALPKVEQVLTSRADRIRTDLQLALTAKDAAEATVRELTEASQRAYAEAHAEIAKAIASAKANADKDIRMTNEVLAQQLSAAEARIAEGAARAKVSLREVAEQTAHLIVGRMTGTNPIPGLVEKKVAEIFDKEAA